MGRLLSLEQIEKGKEIRTALTKINKIIDRLAVASEEPQKAFELSLQPNKEDVIMKINGLEYLENESFTVDRQNRRLNWQGAFDITSKLNVHEDEELLRDSWGYSDFAGSTVLAMNAENIQIHYASEEEYDGLIDPECRARFENDRELTYAPELKTGRARDMSFMFRGCEKLRYLPAYNTKNAQRMRGMFERCGALTDVPAMDTGNVLDMSDMFDGCSSLLAAPTMNTENVIDMSGMFRWCEALKEAPELNTGKVKNMNCMFEGCRNLTTAPQMDTGNVMEMRYMFDGCSSLMAAPQMDTRNVTSMWSMFNGCSALTSVPQMDTRNVTDMQYMFNGCENLVTIGKLNLDKVVPSNSYMPEFVSCIKLQNITFEPKTIHYAISFSDSPKLSKASLLSILNGLGTPKSSNKTLTLHADSKALLSVDEIKIAIDKGWTVA